MAAPGSEKSSKKKTEKKLAAREEAKLLAGFMGVMNSMRKQVRPGALGAGAGRRPAFRSQQAAAALVLLWSSLRPRLTCRHSCTLVYL